MSQSLQMTIHQLWHTNPIFFSTSNTGAGIYNPGTNLLCNSHYLKKRTFYIWNVILNMVTYTIFSPITFRGRRTMSSYVSCNKTKFIRLNFSQDYMAHDFPQTAQIMRIDTIFARETVSQFCQAEIKINQIYH